jgi:hypothetical protein
MENKAAATIPPVRSPLEQVTDALEKVSNEKRAVERMLSNVQSASEHQSIRMAELEDNEQNLRDELKRREADVVQAVAENSEVAEREKLLSRRLTEKEVELQRERAELHAQFAAREAALREQIESQQMALNEREATFRLQSHELFSRTAMLEREHAALQHELKQRAVDHEKAITALQHQKEQFEAEFQSRMESKATEYVDTAMSSLRASEERFDRIGSKWSIGGLLAVLVGLILAYLLATEATDKIVSNKDISWALILFFGAKGAILLGLVVALVRLCLRLARNYLQESLKNAERRHAINYGKFYLSVYGAGTDGEKLKEVFAHWNISGTSAFAEKDDPLPQQSISDVGELAKALVGLKKAGKEVEKD